MGLDLVVEGRPKPGHESEWRAILERSFNSTPIEGDDTRFNELIILPYEELGAPQVGFDQEADDWIIKASSADTPEKVSKLLSDARGYYVLRLIESDGIPKYSHGGLYDGVDETSFRGAFLDECGDVLSKEQMLEAWDNRFPDDAVKYGHDLLAAADHAAEHPPSSRRGLFGFGGKSKSSNSTPFEDQLDIVRAAGRWFIFWGERGNAIRAWF